MWLQTLEQFWLAKSPFLAGNEISIADLLHGCELDQLCLLDGADQVRCAHTLSSTSLLFQVYLKATSLQYVQYVPEGEWTPEKLLWCQVESNRRPGHSLA